MKEQDPKEEVDVALEAWARWALTVFDGIGWPKINILARIIKYGVRGAAQNAGIRLVEVDEVCELVDRALLRLSERERAVVCEHYLRWQTTAVSARNLHMSLRRFQELLRNGRRRVADYLEGAKLRYAQ